MAHRVPITVRLDSFEGPLDLLLYLIQSHELDITKVSLAKLTDQYLAYVRLMQELNFDIASEFLVMAATLLLWKSKSLLPQENDGTQGQAGDGEEEFSPEDLLRQLLEHQRFLAAGKVLSELPRRDEDVFTRPNLRPPVEKVWKDMDITSIALGYQDLVKRARKRKTILRKETVSIADRIMQFADKLEVGAPTALRSLLSSAPERGEIVVTFLASLELARMKKLRVHQEKTFEEIYLELLMSLQGIDLALATGFDAESGQKSSLISSVENQVHEAHIHQAAELDAAKELNPL